MDSVVARNASSAWEQASTEEGRRGRSNRVSWFLLVTLLTFAPMAFGAVEYWAIAAVETLVLCLALSWVLGSVRRDQVRLRMNSLVWSALGLQLWVALQIILHLTHDRPGTREDLLLLFSYFLVFLVVSNESWSPRWIRRLAIAIAVIGMAMATFGIAQFFTWNGSLYWIRPIKVGTPFGPYVNRNHFAGLMEMTFPMALSLAYSPRLGTAWKALMAFAGVVMGLATFMCNSRAGLFSFTLSLVMFTLTFARRYGKKPAVLTGFLAALTLGWSIWLGGEPFLRRIVTLPGFTQGASYEDRIIYAKATLRIIQDHPFAGTGLGTFALMSPGYLYWPSKLAVDKAHNDYLQLLSEVGLIGFAFAVLWIAGLFRSILSMIRNTEQPFSIIRLGAFCGCLALLVHSFVDFNLQIPANALFFAVLAALATRSDAAGRSQRSPDSQT